MIKQTEPQNNWQRILQVYFGVTTYSIAVIVAAYMSAWESGRSAAAGSRGECAARWQFLAGMQLGIGPFGLISPQIILSVGRATAGSSYAVVFGVSFALLLIPTVLMGATLPLLASAFVHRVESAGRIIGLLYGINTFGAAIGSLAAGFVLIGWLRLAGMSNWRRQSTCSCVRRAGRKSDPRRNSGAPDLCFAGFDGRQRAVDLSHPVAGHARQTILDIAPG